jgi:hypothetical protein
MDKEELELLLTQIANCRAKADGLQMREYVVHPDVEITRALLAASWSLRAAHYCLQLAVGLVESRGVTRPEPGVSHAG